MNRKVLFKVMLVLVCFFVFQTVNAATCTTEELNQLKQEAHNVKFNYEIEVKEVDDSHTYYFDVIATNFNENLYVETPYGMVLGFDTNEGNQKRYFIDKFLEGSKYTFNIYSSDKTSCENTKLSTKTLDVPYFNDYSLKEECIGNEDFDMCQKHYSDYIKSDEVFQKALKEYKENGGKKVKDKDKSMVEVVLSFLTNPIVIVGAVIVVAVIILLIIRAIRKNKKRVKIDL